MSKALVIKGADFSENSLAQVTFDVIHATDISVTPSTLALNAIGATAQLSYAVVPSNAEDAVRFSSSNSDVATVSSNGLVTVVGCGSCTITATAGAVSAVCSVTVIVPLTENYVKAVCTFVGAGNKTNTITAITSYNSNKLYQTGRMAVLAISDDSSDLPLPYVWVNDIETDPNTYKTTEWIESHNPWSQLPGWLVPIKLPHNCTKIKFKQLNANYGVCPLFYQYNVPSAASNLLVMRKDGVASIDSYVFAYETETIVDVPSGWDSFTATWQHTGGKDAHVFDTMSASDLSKFTVEFM